jgi:hypothetical protein
VRDTIPRRPTRRPRAGACGLSGGPLILGGLAKTNDLEACAPYFGHVKAAYTIGEAGPMFAALLRERLPVSECERLERAVGAAAEAAVSGEVVLLSPACASFDQFKDYEARGMRFAPLWRLCNERVAGGRRHTGAQAPGINKFGRSDRSTVGRWFWEIDRVLLLLVAVLISIGLIAVAAASPAAATRYSGGAITFTPLIISTGSLSGSCCRSGDDRGLDAAQERPPPPCLGGAAFFTVLLVFVPIIGQEVNGARRWIGVGFAQFQPSEVPEAALHRLGRLAPVLARQGQEPAGGAAHCIASRHQSPCC